MLLKEQKIRTAKGISGLQLPEYDVGSDLLNKEHKNPFIALREELQSAKTEIKRLQEKLAVENERRFAEGFKAGEKSGYAKGVASIAGRVHELGSVLQKLSEDEGSVLKSAQQFVIDFCFAIVAKIIGEEEFAKLPLSEKRLRQITDHALNEFSESSKYVIHVHKGLAETLQTYKEEIKAEFGRDIAVIIQDDPSLKPGDCLIESDFGVLDARIESQWSELRSIFTGA